MDYESQIETLKTEMEVLRTTLTEAYHREQEYKSLVDQLDMAESRANQKWGAFHNGVVQQWSNHCDYLQQQLDFSAVKMREMSTAYHPEQKATRDTSESGAAPATTSTADFENYGDHQQQQQQQQTSQQHLLPDGQDSSAMAAGATHAAMMTTRPPMPPMPPVPSMPYLSPPGNGAYIPTPPLPYSTPSYPMVPPCPPPMPYQQQQPMTGRMVSACHLQRLFSNLAMIEKAQLEGRAYPLSSSYSYEEDDDLQDDNNTSSTAAHTPRRARAFGSGAGLAMDQEQDYHQGSSFSSSSFSWKPTASPFVPDIHV